MPQFHIYVTTNEVPAQALDLLRSSGTVKVYGGTAAPPRDVLLKEAAEADALFCILTEKVDAELLSKAPRLKVVANMAVGFDNIDLAEATKHGVLVTNTPEVLTETTADATFALILAAGRRIAEGDRLIRSGGWKLRWSPMMMVGHDVYGKTLGIYGLRRIGAAVARRAAGFGMNLVYYDSSRNKDLEEKLGVKYLPFDDLMRESDFLTVHVPLLPTTRKSLGEKQLGLMKKTAYVINTSRGQVIDEAALTQALRERRIAGAAIDVFENEPLGPESGLTKLENVVLTPHLASASIETRTEMAMMAARNLAAALKGEVPPNLVNKDVLAVRKAR
ncbi:MAG: D-glycerate dehydrogenase [Nitrososphaerota archaeon]|nr:D-glycerate dehydrogenase [Nitrososphaerota archaeon]